MLRRHVRPCHVRHVLKLGPLPLSVHVPRKVPFMPPLRLSSHHGVVALMIMIRKAPRKVLRMPILSFRIGVCQGSPEGSAHAPFKFPRWSVAPPFKFPRWCVCAPFKFPRRCVCAPFKFPQWCVCAHVDCILRCKRVVFTGLAEARVCFCSSLRSG